jgi:hypothetical protein
MPSTFPLPNDQISALQQVTIQNVAAGLVFNVNVSRIDAVLNINNWPSTYPLPNDQISALQQVTIQNVAAGLYIPIDVKQISAQLNINNWPSSYPLPDTQVSTLQQITIQNVAAGLYIPINIAKADATVNSNATISGVVAGVYVPITIHNIESGVIFDVNITNVNSGVVFNVNVTGTPTVNIQTSGGANIVIDKLTQSAYTERQSVLANNGATPSMIGVNLTYKRGKFFPRGCRGYIMTIEIYCNNADTVSHTFTIKLSPMPGMGPVATFTLPVAAGSIPAWRSVTVQRFWNYDSLFIWVCSDSDSYGLLGYDNGAPYDFYSSTDEVSWSFSALRLWVRVSLSGETVGDLPVSGTVNAIEVPAFASGASSGVVSISALGYATLLAVSGSGVADFICLTGRYSDMRFDIFVDGQKLFLMPFDNQSYSLVLANWKTGYGSLGAGSGIVLAVWDTTNNWYSVHINVPIHFRRSLEIKCMNGDSSAPHDAGASCLFRRIS